MKRFLILTKFCFIAVFLLNNGFSQSYQNSFDFSSSKITLDAKKELELRKSNDDQNFWKQVDTLIYIDTIFMLENIGMDLIIVELNGYLFRLTIDPFEIDLGDNIFLMPAEGTLIIDIGKYINPDPEVTIIRWNYQGQIGDSTEIIIGDESILMGEDIDFVLDLVELPHEFEISQNFPNPFNEITNIIFMIPASWQNGAAVDLSVYNLLGQKVKTLFSGQRLYGDFTVQWDGRNDQGVKVASGIYLYRIQTRDQLVVKKMFLIK